MTCAVLFVSCFTDDLRQRKPTAAWGIHGYEWEDTPPKQGTGNPKAKIGRAFYGDTGNVTVLRYIDMRAGYSGKFKHPMTLWAVAYIALFRQILTMDSECFTVQTSPSTAHNGVTGLAAEWKVQNWIFNDKDRVEDTVIWEELLRLTDEVRKTGKIVTFGTQLCARDDKKENFGFTVASKLALMARAEIFRTGSDTDGPYTTITEAKGYWKVNSERPCEFTLMHKQVYVSNLGEMRAANGRFVNYFITRPSGDDIEGKRSGAAAYCIIQSDMSDPVVDQLKAMADEMRGNTRHRPFIIRLDRVYSPGNSQILSGEELAFYYPTKTGDICAYTGESIVECREPPALFYRAYEELNQCAERFSSIQEGCRIYALTDVTEELYDTIPKKNGVETRKIKPSFVQSTMAVTFKVDIAKERLLEKDTGEVKTVSLRMVPGVDIPDRNSISRLAGTIQKVSVVTWRDTDVSFRYALIIETERAAMYWSPTDSNIRILPKSATGKIS